MAEKNPAPQLVHGAAEPEPAYLPASQDEQTDADDDEALPASQSEQDVYRDPPESTEYFPAAQAEHEV
jgi:hypothetical protein